MNFNQKHLIRLALTGIVFTGMAVTLPSCPGQQALQEQVDTMSQSVNKQTKAVNDLSAQVRGMNEELNTMKSLVAQVSNTVLAQKQSLEEMQAKVTMLEGRTAGAGKFSARSSSTPKRPTSSHRR